MNKQKNIIILFISLFTTWHVNAQDEIAPQNTGAANFLLLTTDARSAGMGGVGTAVPNNNQAIFSNGATTGLQPETYGISYGFAPLMRDVTSGHSLHSLAGFYKLRSKHIILGGFRYYHYPEVGIISTDASTSTNIRPKEWSIDIGYAYKILPQLTASATIKWIHSDIGAFGEKQKADAVAFDIGVVYGQSFSFCNGGNWAIGAQFSNLGNDLQYHASSQESLPALFKAGASVDLSFSPAHSLLIASDIRYRMNPADVRTTSIGIGVEYTLLEHFKARSGYHYGDEEKGDDSYATAGLGVECWRMQIDFAWLFAEKENAQRNSWWISLGYAF